MRFNGSSARFKLKTAYSFAKENVMMRSVCQDGFAPTFLNSSLLYLCDSFILSAETISLVPLYIYRWNEIILLENGIIFSFLFPFIPPIRKVLPSEKCMRKSFMQHKSSSITISVNFKKKFNEMNSIRSWMLSRSFIGYVGRVTTAINKYIFDCCFVGSTLPRHHFNKMFSFSLLDGYYYYGCCFDTNDKMWFNALIRRTSNVILAIRFTNRVRNDIVQMLFDLIE